jgi:broad specificity phosphatase PhoE
MSGSAPTRLVLIRHGETVTNAGGERAVMSGRSDLPLSSVGRRQLELLRERLTVEPGFEAVYTSPLSRARETARMVPAVRPPTVMNELAEIDCGDVDGRLIAEVQSRYPRLWATNAAELDDNFRWPAGESYRELRARGVAAMQTIHARHPGGRVAVVTHAGLITQVVGMLRGEPAARWSAARVANTALTTIDWQAGSGRLVALDDHAHLHGASISGRMRRPGG